MSIAGTILCQPSTGIADVVWPSLFLEQRLLSVVPITAGLVIEFIALRYGFGLSWRRSVVVDLVMNAISALIGAFAIPFAGLAWEFSVGVLIYKYFGVGTFNPGTWLLSLAFAVFLTTSIELGVVRWLFRLELNRRRVLILLLANGLSVGVAFASLLIKPFSLRSSL